MNVTAELERELEELRAKDLYREVRIFEDHQGTHAYYQGRKLTLFCGNDYLGFSHHPRLAEIIRKTASELGAGAGAARLISGSGRYHSLLETKLAQFKRKERALVFSAGYLANIGTLSALAGEKDLIVMDKLCHASLIDGARLSHAQVRVFPHLNYQRCEEILAAGAHYPKKILVSDTVFSMDGDLADIQEMVRIKKKHGCLLVLDDAHGTGVLGQRGSGAAEDLHLESEIDVITGTLSKALGSLGGYVAASSVMADYLVNKARSFIFATALPPILCAAVYEALCILEEDDAPRQKLWRNIQTIHNYLSRKGLAGPRIQSPIFPIMIGGEKEAIQISKKLLEKGVLIPAVRYPTVQKGKARLRLTVSAAHSEEDLGLLFQALDTVDIPRWDTESADRQTLD